MASQPVRFARLRAALSLGSHRRNSVVLVAAGGGVGALVRYDLGLRFAHPTLAFPTVTLVINLTGSFVLGGLLTLVLEFWPPTRYVRPFGAIGVLGGYTTFSTFTVEIVRLVQANRTGLAVTYAAVSLLGGAVAVYLGSVVAGLWPAIEHRLARREAGD